MPLHFTFIIEYLIVVTCDNSEQLLLYGITPTRKRNLILRMSESIQKGIEIKDRLTLEETNLIVLY
jgi:hypothetical protein